MKLLRLFLAVSMLVLLVTACATKKIDWGSRVGNYNYDQAVLELGPPDKMAKLSDGTTVADWYERRGSGFSLGLGTGISRGPVGVGVGVPIGGRRAGVLRLAFDPDGTLKSWAR